MYALRQRGLTLESQVAGAHNFCPNIYAMFLVIIPDLKHEFSIYASACFRCQK